MKKKLLFSFSASSLFGIQHQITHPLVKSSTLPCGKMLVFQSVATRHTIFTSPCVIPLWDLATTHSPSGKELNPSSQEDARFSGRCTLAYNFHLILLHPTQGLLFVDVLTLSCLGSLWFATHPCYSLNLYVNLYYLWSISIAKDRRYPQYFIIRVVYFYSKRLPLCREV